MEKLTSVTTNKNKFIEVVKAIGDVGRLSTKQLIEISRNLFGIVSFCNCKLDDRLEIIVHRCTNSIIMTISTLPYANVARKECCYTI